MGTRVTGAPQVGIRIPTLLRVAVEGRSQIFLSGSTFGELKAALLREFPALYFHLFDEQGQRRPHIVMFVNGDFGRRPTSDEFPLLPGDELEIVHAVSGG